MTTLVALATKDTLVMGCDSLGSVNRTLVDPLHLVRDFFDPNDEWKLKSDEQGKPFLKTFGDIWKKQWINFSRVIKPFPGYLI